MRTVTVKFVRVIQELI